MMISKEKLLDFIQESNDIEKIFREPLAREIAAYEWFLFLKDLSVDDICKIVQAFEPGAKLRKRIGMDVYVGDYRPPRGGPEIEGHLDLLLQSILKQEICPFEAHLRYEDLHPFIDGNGRSGRALWLWQSLRDGIWVSGRSFERHWYYRSLDFFRGR